MQRKFIGQTTDSCDYAVYLNRVKSTKPWEDCIVIGRSDSADHDTALNEILKYFRKHEYKNYLILDSDCFPIVRGWQRILLDLMKDRWYAAAIRPENGEFFPHPSIVFIKGRYIHDPSFDFTFNCRSLNNINNRSFRQSPCLKKRIDNKPVMLSLLRSNVFNIHPVVAGIYANLFYHHGAGSRQGKFRTNWYWGKLIPEFWKNTDLAYELLTKDPHKFISQLMGESYEKFIADAPRAESI